MRNSRQIDVTSLIYVFLYSVFIAILAGIVFGYVDYFLMMKANLSLGGLFYWISAIYLGKTVSKVSENHHIVYVIIGTVFMLFTYMLIDTIPSLIHYGFRISDVNVFLNPVIYFKSFLLLIYPLTGVSMGILQYILTMLILIVGTYLGVQQMK